jgi:hypothetical protein
LCLLLAVSDIQGQDQTGLVTENFKQFCSQYRLNYLNTGSYTPEINEKDQLIEIRKDKLTIQFSEYNNADGQSLFVFSSFRDTCCGSPEITSGCYTKENGAWKDITSEVMPALTYNDFYGRDAAPPSQYLNAVQFRYVLHKNNQLQVVIEPKGQFDEKYLRIFEARKYAAVQLKWDRKNGKFEIQKWLK